MLPAPRDPRASEAVPPDPPPPQVAPLLTGLMRSAGAQAARAVGGAGGRVDVLAEVGLADGDDVAALVQLVQTAAAVGRGRGEWLEDLVVTLGRTVHVLRDCGGVVLHARLDPTRGDLGAVRRGLASADLQRAVEAAAHAQGTARSPQPGPRPPEPTADRLEALPGGRARPRHRLAAPAAPVADDHAADEHPGDVATSGDPESKAPWPYSLEPGSRPVEPGGVEPGGVEPGGVGSGAAEPDAAEPGPAEPPVAEPSPGLPPVRPPAQRRAPVGYSLAAMPTVPGMRPVTPTPRPAPPRPLAEAPAPAWPHAPTQAPPQTPPHALTQPVPPLPRPRPPGGSGAAGQDPALVTVDEDSPVTRSGALAVLALPPLGARPPAPARAAVTGLPRRRRTALAQAAPSPHSVVTPAVLRLPWASDVGTMRHVLACLRRLG